MGNRHVVPSAHGWQVKIPGVDAPESTHTTQAEAERAAKAAVTREGGGEVRIHRPDGTIRDSDTVAPGNDPRSTPDRRH